MAKDRELQDHERAHSGQPGSKVRHGADATGVVKGRGYMGMSTKKEKLVRAHADEINRAGAEDHNFGAGQTDNGIYSKTSKGGLETTIGAKGKIKHEWWD